MLAFPVHIELRRSRAILLTLLGLHALAAFCVLFQLSWPLAARGLLAGVVALSLLRAVRASAVVALHLGERGELALSFADGSRHACLVCPETTVFAQLVVLRAAEDEMAEAAGERYSLVLAADSMRREQFRLLRVWLRWRVSAGDSGQPAVAA
ncbi:MAG: protein YgfX [Candidatus Accumulibacter sp.]|uniref:protein YgfX n=1 Tax=Accumulibacter sp. TaxID=2053492 RepID=UPI00287A329A|nr:protein YgfX [Accumulibacter sp.]MDS4015822.1 protein YgfX [Accumulibacter sp.]